MKALLILVEQVKKGLLQGLGMLISNFSQIRISNVIIRSKSGYQISSELH